MKIDKKDKKPRKHNSTEQKSLCFINVTVGTMHMN